ncbi:MAG: thiamine pyrophosphate-dependent enzyme [Candidatus Gracilibacteria bacterium]|nr:thiamine pyrophosphate-dependent enzyme [Candidatus Gracilibacteria bacterium]
MTTLKQLAGNKPRLVSGHRLCPGCGMPAILKQVTSVVSDPMVIINATGCFEICTGAYPYTSWNCSWIHSLFENTAAVASGVESAYKALQKRGKLQENFKFLALGGDGGTYDIGFQALSGAMERGHKFVYLCFDNEGYMNTGYQRSGATPLYAHTTTSPAGSAIPGKTQGRKDLTGIMVAHKIPYVAQASASNWADLTMKAEKAFEADGPAFLNVLSQCPTSWKTKPEDGIKKMKQAVESNFWPLYEVEHGKYKINYKPKERLPIKEWLAEQGRFKHLFKEGNEKLIAEIQEDVDDAWKGLLAKENN